MQSPRLPAAPAPPARIHRWRTRLPWLAWTALLWIVLFWRLGYPSFWDPDEAHYAQATREMLASGNWLVPTYNGAPFFDKPILFYWLQLVAFRLLGPTEFAARLVPALSALGLFGATAWLGRRLFGGRVGALATMMLALLPATFALSAYAILDMTFTAFLVGGLGLVAVAALRGRSALQYPGYALVALAVLTKGPLALALSGLTFVVVLLIAPDARRPLLNLRWMLGLSGIVAVSAPWFLYMSLRFGRAFIEWYFFHENLSLYARPIFGPAASTTYFVPVILVGLLPWSPMLAGRIVDIARGDRPSDEERLLWAWSLVVFGFFSFSHFKLDHYVYPLAPTLCLLTASAWHRLREAPSIRPHLGAAIGGLIAAITLVAGGVALLSLVRALPLELARWAYAVPVAFMVSGGMLLAELVLRRCRPPRWPIGVAAAWLAAYAVLLGVVLPEFERGKPVKDLAQWAAGHAPIDAPACAYGMDRWNTSWRFYVERPVAFLETHEDVRRFLSRTTRAFCLMLRSDLDAIDSAGTDLVVLAERAGLFTTSGRAIQENGHANWRSFVIVGAANHEH